MVNGLSPSLSQPMSLLLYFLSPVQLRSVSDRAALVGTWQPARVNPPQYCKATMVLLSIIPVSNMVVLAGSLWVSQVAFRKWLYDFGGMREEWECITHAELLMRQRQLGFLPSYIGALAPNPHRFLGFQLVSHFPPYSCATGLEILGLMSELWIQSLHFQPHFYF